MFTPRVVEEREREKREKREKVKKKKMGGAGKTQKNLFVSRKFLSQIKEEREEFLVFNPPRGALVLFILQNFIRVYHDRE